MVVQRPEWWLAALLPLLYLKDCLLLLEPGEAVLKLDLRQRWQAGFGLQAWTLRGREPYLCHPLRPFEPVWRMPWLTGRASAAQGQPLQVPAALLALRPWVVGIWCLLFGMLPACLLYPAPLTITLAAVILMYGAIGAALALTWKARHMLDLSPAGFAAVACEVLLCPPCAANLLRKLSLGMAHADHLAGVASRWMPPTAQSALYARCRARLDAHIAQYEPDDPQAIALASQRRRFDDAAG